MARRFSILAATLLLLPPLLFPPVSAGEGTAADTVSPPALALVLTDKDGAEVFSCPVAAGERFGVAFTHSLALSRVEEFYEVVAEDEFRLRETVYADFGAGLPHEETGGLRMEFGDGRIWLRGFDIVFRDVWLRIGHIADHRLLTPEGREVRLADFRPPGSAVRIRVILRAARNCENGEKG